MDREVVEEGTRTAQVLVVMTTAMAQAIVVEMTTAYVAMLISLKCNLLTLD